MAKKMSKINSNISITNGSLPKGDKDNSNKDGKTSTKKKVLTRKQKLAAAKKANQAMMKAWKLISQRKDSNTDAEINF